MFDRLVESTNERRNARTWIFFAASSVTWSVVLAGVAIAGVIMADARLDADFNRLSLVPVTHSASAAPRRRTPQQSESKAPATNQLTVVTQPSEFVRPPQPAAFTGQSLPFSTDDGDPYATKIGDPGGGGGGDGEQVAGGGRNPVPVPPQPPADPIEEKKVAPAPPRPKHIGVITGLATRRVEPPYPELAKAIGAQGAVVVSVTVSETGRVLEANALSGHPSLRQASLDAARRWQFSPTMLNGIPVKVIGTITFNFKKS